MKNILSCLFALILCLPHSGLQAQVSNGLIAKYSFFGNANDEAGTNHGTVQGASLVADRFGVPNRAYRFDGFSGHAINLGNSTTLKPTACTISLWAYIDSNACYQNNLNYAPFIATANQNAPNPFYEAYGMGYWIPQPQILTVNYQSGAASGQACFSAANIQTKRWYHVVFSFDNDSMITYVDNVRICGLQKAFTTTYNNGDVVLGKSTVPTRDAYLNGRLDDIRIYNRRLSTAEVDTLYNLPSVNPTGVTGIAEDQETHVLVHANRLHIQTPQPVGAIRLFDMTGKPVQSLYPDPTGQYPLPALSKGLYLCEVMFQNKGRHVAKIWIP